MQLSDSLSAELARTGDAATAVADAVTDSAFWVGLGASALRIAAALGLALLILAVVKRLKARWVAKALAAPTVDHKRQRVVTVADLVGSVAKYVVWSVVIVTVFAELGFDIGPLLASAGVAGLAIGFGAQTLVKDVISGLFLLFDDSLGTGDLITHGGQTGTVEYVGLRLIKVRTFSGELLMIPAGELRTFGNHSVGFARVVVPVSLAYEQNLDEVLGALRDVAAEWAETEHAKDIMLEDAPAVQSLTELGESGITARIIVQVRPGEQFQADRELKELLKRRFDERGIEIPFPRRTVYVKTDAAPDDGGSPETDVLGAAGA